MIQETTVTGGRAAPNSDARSLHAVLAPADFDPFPGMDSPEAFATAWERKRPWVLANMAHAAYRWGPWVERTMERLGATFVRVYDREGAQAFLAVWDNKAVLAFRGTESHERRRLPRVVRHLVHRALEKALDVELPDEYVALLLNDLLADLRCAKRRLGDARVHGGFLGELKKLWQPLILPDLESRVMGPNIPAYATGHSLGGAMATAAGLLLPFAGVVTFGELRVGSGIGREFRAGVHTRYVNGDDPAPRLPPSWWPFGYEHHGDEVSLVDPEGPDPRYDHSILDYADKLDVVN